MENKSIYLRFESHLSDTREGAISLDKLSTTLSIALTELLPNQSSVRYHCVTARLSFTGIAPRKFRGAAF